MIDYKITNTTLTIIDSYKINTYAEMKDILFKIRLKDYFEHSILLYRTDDSIIEEWRACNLLYRFNICRDKTKDAEFEYPQNWYYKLGYRFLSLLYSIVYIKA